MDPLFGLLYAELKRMAKARLRNERPDHTLQTTALVNEAWLRLKGTKEVTSRSEFLRVAATAMRRVLVDHARGRGRDKRVEGLPRRPLDPETPASDVGLEPNDVVDVDAALTTLAESRPRLAQVIELHYFGGLTLLEVAAVLDVDLSTVKRDHRAAKALISNILSTG